MLACSSPWQGPTWPQLLEVRQHPVGRAGVDAQSGSALKGDVARNSDQCLLAEHCLGPPGSWVSEGVLAVRRAPPPLPPSTLLSKWASRTAGLKEGSENKDNLEVLLNVSESS